MKKKLQTKSTRAPKPLDVQPAPVLDDSDWFETFCRNTAKYFDDREKFFAWCVDLVIALESRA